MSVDQPWPHAETRVTNSQGFQVGSGNTQTNIGVDAVSLPPPQAVGAGAVVHNLPQASAVFVGRDLTVLAERLGGGGAGVVVGQAAVHGLGGIGKSELVNHYAREHLSRYSLVWWITADSAEGVGLGLAALTGRLHPAAKLADAQTWAVGWLQANAGWLLVLDNVEDVNDITELLGAIGERGQVLVTTRRDLGAARWARSGLTPLRLEVLTRPAGVDLLVRLTGCADDAGGAERLAAELGDLPLALEQAAAYISQHDGMSFDGYRKLLSDEFGRVAADAGQGGTTDRNVAAVWTVTVTAIARTSRFALDVLDVLAWLAPEGLPAEVLLPLADNPADVDDALALLASYNMIRRAAGTVGVHRLVQAVTRNTQVVADTAEAVQEQAVQLLVAAIPDDPINNVQGWPRWNALLPHIGALAGNLSTNHQFVAMLDIQDRAATYLQFQGQTNAAIAEFEKVLADTRRVLSEDHPDTLASRHNLAFAYKAAGRLREAIDEYEKMLADRRRVQGADHPDTLLARNNLAAAYRAVGRVGEAIDEYETVLVDLRRVQGADHPDTLMARNNLAAAYQDAGRVGEAIGDYESVLADLRRVLGEDHPYTLMGRNNLAGAYRDAGRVGEAIGDYESVLADSRRVLGEDHPSTLMGRNNLVGAYHGAGRIGEAIDECQKLLADARRVLGPEHQLTRVVAANLEICRRSE
ncbi:tetratricopeptide repeat protein [Actinoplanes sp. NPDC049668]|uniref:tetratricopeptide repeat protein n=1 Tax=unclassified Actinoplanes TaxID=2626549 RepID=UPI0033A340AB